MTSRSRQTWIRVATVFATALAFVLPARAGSSTDTTSPFSINQTLQFNIAYPSFLRFRVGPPGATINLLDFNVAAASVGTSIPIAATGGDAGPSAVNISVVANTGVVTIAATNNSGGTGLGTGVPADGFVNYNEITTSSDSGQLPAPVLANAGTTNSVVSVTSGVVTIRSAVWTFGYSNTTIPNAGIYGAFANGGRVTYTASTP